MQDMVNDLLAYSRYANRGGAALAGRALMLNTSHMD
jgi:hypothetical protein